MRNKINKTREDFILTAREISDKIKQKEDQISKLQKERIKLTKSADEARQDVDLVCFENPKEGDFWHEMYCPVLVVIHVHEDNSLTICEHTKDAGDNKYVFDMSKVRKITREDFVKKIKWHKEEIGYRVIPERCFGIFTQWQVWIAENL